MSRTIILLLCFFLSSCQDAVEELAKQPISEEARELTGKALVDYVNQQQSLWKARFTDISKEDMASRVMKWEYMEKEKALTKGRQYKHSVNESEELPESFDARDAWPECRASIEYIRDQSNCGSCWAVSVASAVTDRICIHSKGRIKTIASDTDILACCGGMCGNGCNGGSLFYAWNYVKKSGVCTGGRYGIKGACMPYAFHPCGNHKNQPYYGKCPRQLFATPKCKRTCQFGYGRKYLLDKIYAKTVYHIEAEELQAEIMKNGPVPAGFSVYEDFYYYKSGIYQHKGGKKAGGHAVKIIGWGVENGTKYWTIANSWNTEWGENGGYFRFIRGINDCGMEEGVVAGMMDV